jgi:hypothetical protein
MTSKIFIVKVSYFIDPMIIDDYNWLTVWKIFTQTMHTNNIQPMILSLVTSTISADQESKIEISEKEMFVVRPLD